MCITVDVPTGIVAEISQIESSLRTPVMHIFLAKGRETVTGGKYSLVRQYFLRDTFISG